MALLTTRRHSKDPEGRMPLREHLAELRSRLIKSGLAIAAGAVVGWFIYDPLLRTLMEPLREIARERNQLITINFAEVTSSFNLKLKLSVYLGVVVASPVWLYQLWAFVVPGLTRREKRYSMGFVAVAVPLFLAGMGLAWAVLPNAVRFLTDFTPQGATNLISADTYLTFVTRMMFAFGIALVIPLFLVALNMAGLVSAHTLTKGWRVAVFLSFLFAALASPTPDAGTMLALAFPIVGLYMAAVGVAWLVDRRRARRAAAEGLAGLSDDEASPVEEAGPIDGPSSV